MLASKHFTPVIGIDIHVTGSGPTPHPYIGLVFDPIDYVPGIGSTVSINGVPRATSGTSGYMLTWDHIPIGGAFVYEDQIAHKSVNFFGSKNVFTDGANLSPAGFLVMTCSGEPKSGIPLSLSTAKGSWAPEGEMYLPTSISIPIPFGKPVNVGGPYPPDLLSLIKNLVISYAFSALKKLAGMALTKFNNAVLKKYEATKGLSEWLCEKGFDPVDLITGRVMYEGVDFELPGIIPIQWKRNWYSDSGYKGFLGHGWHSNYDISLHIEEADDVIVMRLPDGRLTLFPLLIAEEASYYDRTEKLTLTCVNRSTYTVFNHKASLTYTFNKLTGKLFKPVSLSNRDGFKLQFLYNGANQLSQITDTVGRKINFKSDPQNRVTKITATHKGEKRNLVTYDYNESGDLIKITDALGQSTVMAYKNHLMHTKTDRNGQSFYWEYDGDKTGARCIKTWGDDNLLSGSIAYHKDYNIVTNSLGQATIYYFNEAHLCTQITDPLGNHIYHEYTEFMEKYRDIDEEGDITGYNYDNRGNLTKVHHPDGSSSIFIYDEQDQLILTENPGGLSVTRVYNDEGRLKSIISPDDAITSFTYAENGLISKVRDNAGNKTAMFYDDDYNLEKVITNTNETVWSYDSWGRVVETLNSEAHEQYFSYDKLGRVVKITQADKNTIKLEYNAYDEVIKTTDSKRNKTVFEYTPLGSLKMHNKKGRKVHFHYNTEEQLTGITNAHKEMYRIGRNAKGAIINETGFDGLRKEYTRDRAGKVLKVIRPDERFTEYEYDLGGRITRAEHYDNTWESFTYDQGGNIVEAVNQHSHVTFERDKSGRVVKEIQDGHEVSSEYNRMGKRSKITSSLGAEIAIKRNILGLVEEVNASRNIESSSQNSWTAKFSYNSLGQEVERVLQGGITRDTEYDFAGRPVQHRVNRWDRTIRHKAYQWNANDELQRITDQLTKGIFRVNHDDFSKLASVKYEDNQFDYRFPDEVGNLFRTKERTDREYNSGGQLKSTKNTAYTYDQEGNLINKISQESDTTYEWYGNGMLKAVHKAYDKHINFEYDALGRRTAKIVFSPHESSANQLSLGERIDLGNTEKEGLITRFVWNGNMPLHQWQYKLKDRPRTIVNEEGILEQDKPEPLGVTLSTIEGAHTEKYTENKIDTSSFTTWVFDEGTFVPAAKIVEGEQYSIVTDYMGTPVEMYNSKGVQTWAVEYDIYGKIRKYIKGDRTACPFRYQGQYDDIETGLYYNRFRYYAPEEGVYISQDPIGLEGGMNLYAYADNNPTSLVDPLGLAWYDYLRYLHYNRNYFNSPDSGLDYARHHYTPELATYHMQNGAWNNIKFVAPNGSEYIYNSLTEEIDLSFANMGTFNYFNPGDHPILHTIFDVFPYWLWGNKPEDTTPIMNRILGPNKNETNLWNKEGAICP